MFPKDDATTGRLDGYQHGQIQDSEFDRKIRAAKTVQLLSELRQGTLTLLQAMYGIDSSHETVWRSSLDSIQKGFDLRNPQGLSQSIASTRGVLDGMLQEVDAGFIGTLRGTVTGEVVSDFTKLARMVLDESAQSGKDVAAVLSAAAFEDTVRRLAIQSNLPHEEKLADVLDQLKKHGVLQGAQIAITQSYLTFRNKALHAQWNEVDRTTVESVLGFTEQMLLKHFS